MSPEETWLKETSVEHLEKMDEEELADMYHQGYEYGRTSARAHTRLDSIRIADTSMEALKKTLAARRDGVLLAQRRASQRSLGDSSRVRHRALAGEGAYRMRRIYYGEG
ncbi:hypothetical protein JCM8208_000364 [Rhodotorula glutinis]